MELFQQERKYVTRTNSYWMLDFRTAPSQKLILLHTNVCHSCCFVISCFILKVSLSSSVMSCYFLSLYFIYRLICFTHLRASYVLLLASFLSIPACCHVSSAAISYISFFSFFHYWFLFYFGFLLFSHCWATSCPVLCFPAIVIIPTDLVYLWSLFSLPVRLHPLCRSFQHFSWCSPVVWPWLLLLSEPFLLHVCFTGWSLVYQTNLQYRLWFLETWTAWVMHLGLHLL